MAKWKDKNKRFTDEIEESRIKLGIFHLIIHRHICHPPDTWLASCYGLFSQTPLKSKNLEKAKEQAKAKVQEVLEEAIKDISEAQ